MYINQEEVLAAARGQWSTILPRIAPELSEAVQKAPKHVSCPVHGGKDGFRLFRDFEASGGGACNTCGSKAGGISLLMWVLGIPFKQALHLVAQEVNYDVQPVVQSAVDPLIRKRRFAEEEKRNKKILDSLENLWKSSVSITDKGAEPARLYFCRRGLDFDALPPGFVRFIKETSYYSEDGSLAGKYPAIISRFVDGEKQGITLHRTFITQDGKKAPVEKVKKICPYPSSRTMSGGSVWLSDVKECIAVAEGIETAMAVQQATGLPTLAATNAAMLAALIPPKGVKEVCIFADLDFTPSKNGILTPGQDAGKKLQARLKKMGLRTWVFVPSLDDGKTPCDWLDALNRFGAKAFKDPTIRKEI